MIITHRINTLEELQELSSNEAIEFDVRDSAGKCIVQHDAFQEGVDFELFLQAVGSRFLIVNIKSEGIETYVLNSLAKYHCDNFFLLDCSFPKLIELSNQKERRLAVRFSEFESIETVLSLKDRVEWVWVDCFTEFPLTKKDADRIHQIGMKICLVSPDLQKRPQDVASYVKHCVIENISINAVCCKKINRCLWEEYFTLSVSETVL